MSSEDRVTPAAVEPEEHISEDLAVAVNALLLDIAVKAGHRLPGDLPSRLEALFERIKEAALSAVVSPQEGARTIEQDLSRVDGGQPRRIERTGSTAATDSGTRG